MWFAFEFVRHERNTPRVTCQEDLEREGGKGGGEDVRLLAERICPKQVYMTVQSVFRTSTFFLKPPFLHLGGPGPTASQPELAATV